MTAAKTWTGQGAKQKNQYNQTVTKAQRNDLTHLKKDPNVRWQQTIILMYEHESVKLTCSPHTPAAQLFKNSVQVYINASAQRGQRTQRDCRPA